MLCGVWSCLPVGWQWRNSHTGTSRYSHICFYCFIPQYVNSRDKDATVMHGSCIHAKLADLSNVIDAFSHDQCRWYCENLALSKRVISKLWYPVCSRIFMLIWDPVQDWTSSIRRYSRDGLLLYSWQQKIRVLKVLGHQNDWCSQVHATLLKRTSPKVQGIIPCLKDTKAQKDRDLWKPNPI